MEKHGQVDIMFNNAGTGDDPKSSVAEYEIEMFERTMNVNAKGVLHGRKHAARGLWETLHLMQYTASKHAIIGLTKNGAAELGKYGIRVNCISPSYVATGLLVDFLGTKDKGEAEAWISSINNLKRVVVKEEDIAQAALFLGSDESKFVSVHNLVVDGGFSVVNHDGGLSFRPGVFSKDNGFGDWCGSHMTGAPTHKVWSLVKGKTNADVEFLQGIVGVNSNHCGGSDRTRPGGRCL
ncbi:short-chain dehydrogenase reductase 2a-like [Cryptomeria japonica]|uniref:short-chain dehydrogenase reductase 2a-like n=1 Tax=Cryptomeria japonica TaxID=3369 RepID=UPI0027DA6009|nr:short-chain dehydrogenase reductase 2a-like [Cryptomeria japonica]